MHFLEVDVDEAGEGKVLALVDPASISGADRTEDGSKLRLWFASVTDAEACAPALRAAGFALARAGVVGDRNWNESWQKKWSPFLVGRSWYLSPPWMTAPTPAGRVRLDLHPGVAFGNGDHPATHACLMLMEDAAVEDARFLDVGCGSGLLMEAAAKLGARVVAGCDLDLASVTAARLHGGAFAGSVDAVASSAFDVVAANIQLGVLERVMEDLRRVLAPGGCAILSGILMEQVDALRRAAGSLQVLRIVEAGGWAGVLLTADLKVAEGGGLKERPEADSS